MNTYQLLEELSKKPTEEIKWCLLALMKQRKIDYTDLSTAYVKFLEGLFDDCENKLIEAETCVSESFFCNKTKDKRKSTDYKHTQRCMYLLDQSKRFNMDSDFKKFQYDKEFAKNMSWYERNKGMDH